MRIPVFLFSKNSQRSPSFLRQSVEQSLEMFLSSSVNNKLSLSGCLLKPVQIHGHLKRVSLQEYVKKLNLSLVYKVY